MRVAIVGGGPSGLYLSILLKRADPDTEILVLERNRSDDTFGFGVVFSDATIAEVESADEDTYAAISNEFVRWDDIDVHYRDEVIRSTGHGFSGMSRRKLLIVLQERAAALGVELRFETEIAGAESLAGYDLVVAADGLNSTVRESLEDDFRPTVDWRPNRFVWMGTTKPFPAFTFYFKENEAGLWRVHAYQYEPGHSTFIVECTEETWRGGGMEDASEEETLAYCEALFAAELEGHRLTGNKSVWRSFPTIRSERWSANNVVLIGDAAHTAHFSIGSGTRMGMLDAIALRDALMREWALDGPRGGSQPAPGDTMASRVQRALTSYEEERRPAVESLQRAAQASLEWFEATERYMDLHPVQLTFTLLTRSLRITHEDLRIRDPEFLARVDAWVAGEATGQSGAPIASATPPMFTPFKLRELVIPNRVVVSPMCQYCADDGTVRRLAPSASRESGCGRRRYGIRGDDRRLARRPHLDGVRGPVQGRARGGVEEDRGLHPHANACEDGNSTRTCGQKGRHEVSLGGRFGAGGRRTVGHHLRLSPSLLPEAQSDPARDDAH